MNILGIETSCDETAVAVASITDEISILSDIMYSQVTEHASFGGVVPEVASRKHFELIDILTKQAIAESKIEPSDLDAVAVTSHPGLIGALLVGVSFAKAFAYGLGKPLIAVDHIAGHIAANFLEHPELEPPFVCLVASGGHSLVVLVEKKLEYKILGGTLDDAAGEAFDKIARVLGLGYPGGPLVSNLAKSGDSSAIKFPRPIFGLDFSFSGVKTAVINYVHKNGTENAADIAASFEQAVVDVLVNVAIEATKQYGCNTLCLAGGVAANQKLRHQLHLSVAQNGIRFYTPKIEYCGDNAAMICCAGYFQYLKNDFAPLDLNATARL